MKGFLRAVEQGATALELDVQLTADDQVVVWHDPMLLPHKATDTHPARRGDPDYPYVGARVRDLTYRQLSCVDVGSSTSATFPAQQLEPGARIPLLAEVLDAVHQAAPTVWFLVELKIDPTDPTLTAPPEVMVPAVLDVVTPIVPADRVVVQSFDWRVVQLAADLAPDLPRSALATVGRTFVPESPWLGNSSFEQHDGDLAAAAAALGVHAVTPALRQGPHPVPNIPPLVPDHDFVARAHDLGLAVLPWTVNDPTLIAAVLNAGADGLITDFPDRAVSVAEELSGPGARISSGPLTSSSAPAPRAWPERPVQTAQPRRLRRPAPTGAATASPTPA